VATYLPLYAQEEVGVSVTTAGQVLAVMGLVAIPGRILWGSYVDRSSTHVGSLMLLSGLGVIAALVLWGSSSFGPVWLWLGAIAWALSQLSFGAVSTLAVMSFVARERAGQATGVLLVGFSVGLMLGPILFGLAVDATNSYDTGFAAVIGVLVTATITTALWQRQRTSPA
jgi:ACS family tartrate transporter-like MFS transporter